MTFIISKHKDTKKTLTSALLYNKKFSSIKLLGGKCGSFVESDLLIGEIITAITRLDAVKGRKALVISIMSRKKSGEYV